MNKDKFSKARGIVCLVCLVLVVAGLIWRIGGGTISALGFESIALVCPVGMLEVMLGATEFMLHPIVLLVIAIILILLVGKAFCSWVCPVPWLDRFFHPKKKHNQVDGAVEGDGECDGAAGADGADGVDGECAACAEFAECSSAACASDEASAEVAAVGECGEAGDVDGKTKGKKLKKIGGKRDGVQFDSRHFTLIGALGSAAIFGFPVFCLICPVGLTCALIVGLVNMFTGNEPSWGIVLFAVILVLEIVFFRKWCSKICPISALVGLISAGNKTFKPHVDKSKCLRSNGVDCHVCVDKCPEEVDPHSSMIPECSKCGECVASCPAQAITLKFLAKKDAKELEEVEE